MHIDLTLVCMKCRQCLWVFACVEHSIRAAKLGHGKGVIGQICCYDTRGTGVAGRQNAERSDRAAAGDQHRFAGQIP